MFDQLDFIYLPSRDVAADLDHYKGMSGDVVFTIERFGTRVVMIALAADGPKLLLAQTPPRRTADPDFRVDDLDAASGDLQRSGVTVSDQFEFPYGHRVELENPGPQRMAIYERTLAGRGNSLAGRRDF